jgi:hypothetical protein
MSTPASSTGLRFDPGRKHRAAPSLCRCACWILLALVGACSLALVGFLGRAFSRAFRFPHEDAYFKGSVETANPSAFLRPLIDHEQLFDIGVTVWLRAPQNVEKLSQENSDSVEETSDDKALSTKEPEEEEPSEVPLYADIPLRGLRITEKGVHTNISFRVPTAIL